MDEWMKAYKWKLLSLPLGVPVCGWVCVCACESVCVLAPMLTEARG